MTIDIAELKPADRTVAALETALARVDAARAKAEKMIADHRLARMADLEADPSRDVREWERIIADAHLDLDLCDSLRAEILSALRAAREREAHEAPSAEI